VSSGDFYRCRCCWLCCLLSCCYNCCCVFCSIVFTFSSTNLIKYTTFISWCIFFTSMIHLFLATVLLSFSVLLSVADDSAIVSCGSVIKLRHKETGHHLHSHQIAWGSGSGQQSVTGHGSSDDFGSMWIIKEPFRSEACEVGTPVKCGSKLRLEHAATGKNLHSHLFSAPVSGQQEVSAYGERGEGDTGDNWELLCESGKTT
jgi:hypothetical protein